MSIYLEYEMDRNVLQILPWAGGGGGDLDLSIYLGLSWSRMCWRFYHRRTKVAGIWICPSIPNMSLKGMCWEILPQAGEGGRDLDLSTYTKYDLEGNVMGDSTTGR